MASTYSTNLALELMATGEKANTWGDITNTNLGTLLEQSISGYVTQAITDGSGATTTITIPNGASGVARNMFIEMTGALTFGTTSLVVPANKKLYFIYNNTSGGFAVTVKVSGLTGVSVPNGQKMVLVSNGTDVVVATNYMATLAIGALTSGRVPYVTTAGLLTDAANLTFNGTTLTANTIGAFTLSGTVAGGGNQINNVIIGTTTPLAGSFTTLAASSTVSGTGFSNYLASPPAIGGSAAAAGSFTTLSASSTVSGTGFSNYLASPPAIGGSAPAAGAFTTLSATGALTYGGVTLTNAVTGTGKMVLDTSPTINNQTVTNYIESVVAIGTVTSSNTLSLTNGTVQTATLTASTACTFTMPTATAGKSFVLLLKQAASTGNGTATFTGVKFGTAGAPTITATAGKMDILTFIADGTNWYGSIAQGYTP